MGEKLGEKKLGKTQSGDTSRIKSECKQIQGLKTCRKKIDEKNTGRYYNGEEKTVWEMPK